MLVMVLVVTHAFCDTKSSLPREHVYGVPIDMHIIYLICIEYVVEESIFRMPLADHMDGWMDRWTTTTNH